MKLTLSDVQKINQFKRFDMDWEEYDRELVRLYRLSEPNSNVETALTALLYERDIIPTRIDLKRLERLYLDLKSSRVKIEMRYFEKHNSFSGNSCCVAGWAYIKNRTFRNYVENFGWNRAIFRYFLKEEFYRTETPSYNWLFSYEWFSVAKEQKPHAIARVEYCIDNPTKPIPFWFSSPLKDVEKYIEVITPYI